VKPSWHEACEVWRQANNEHEGTSSFKGVPACMDVLSHI
jgi:hypothetical protein